MQDCELSIKARDGVMKLEGHGISLEEMATMAGFLQVAAGMEGLRRGLGMDDVKGNMLDIHLAAMETLEEQERGGAQAGLAAVYEGGDA